LPQNKRQRKHIAIESEWKFTWNNAISQAESSFSQKNFQNFLAAFTIGNEMTVGEPFSRKDRLPLRHNGFLFQVKIFVKMFWIVII
jgi:hypothetical protein